MNAKEEVIVIGGGRIKQVKRNRFSPQIILMGLTTTRHDLFFVSACYDTKIERGRGFF